MLKSAEIADGESLEFTLRGNDPVLGLSEFEISVVSINGHTLSLEKYSQTQASWYATGDNALTAVGIERGSAVAGGLYRVRCSGGTGAAVVEVAA